MMTPQYQFLPALALCLIAAGCIRYPVEPYDPPTDSRISIGSSYDDRENNYGSALTVSASFRDRFAGTVWINDDTLTMNVSAVDTFNVVRYSRNFSRNYSGSIDFNGGPFRLRVQGNSAVPALDEQFSVPERIRIISPAANDTVGRTGFLLQWNATPGDSTYIHFSGTIYLDTLVVGDGSLLMGEQFFKGSSERSYSKIHMRLTRKWSSKKLLPDESTLRFNAESQTNRDIVYAFRP